MKSPIKNRLFWMLGVVLAIVLVPSLVTAGNQTEVVGGLKWTYSVENNTAYVKGVASEQGDRIEGTVAIPASFNGGAYVVTGVGYRAFANAEYLLEVVFPQTIGYIGEESFRGCKRLTTVKLPPSVQKIWPAAFRDCAGLRAVTLNEGLVTIDAYAFQGCASLRTIAFPSTVASIGSCAFVGTPLEAVELPDSLKELGREAFADCDSLETVSVGKRLAVLPYRAFYDCDNLRSVTIGEGCLDAVGEECFRGCKRLVEVKHSSPVQKVGRDAFKDSPLEKQIFR